MQERSLPIEERLEELSRQVSVLTRRVVELEGRAGIWAPAAPAPPIATPPPPPRQAAPSISDEPESISEEVIGWAGRVTLLPRLATLCFLLVVALILRTITDSGMINTLVGSGLGMGYAALLMIAGWYTYRKTSPLAPVFAACGAVLMALIVLETHTRFQSLPLVPAYLTLMGTGIGMAVISYQFSVLLPVSLGTLGMCLAGAAIDYPNPFFPYLAMVLFTANLLGYYAATLRRCSWLRWTVLVVTLVMLQLWGVRLGIAIHRHTDLSPLLAQAWFLPILGLFAATYLAIALMGIVRSRGSGISRFDIALPTINVAWCYLLGRYVIGVSGESLVSIGLIAIGFVLLHAGAGYWIAGRRIQGAHGTNSLMVAAAVLLAIALPDATGSLLAALPALSAAAFGLALLSRHWESGGVRLTSYLLQGYAAAALTAHMVSVTPASSPIFAMTAATLLAAIGLAHYRWCRSQPPPAGSQIFGRYDRSDTSAVALILSSLVSVFCVARTGLYLIVAGPSGEPTALFRCGQTIIINLAAIGLILLAHACRNKEFRNVAILVLLVGGVKVFLYDLMSNKGLPLVLSVFTFGLAAALISIFLGRWQNKPTTGTEAASSDSSPPPGTA